MGQLNHIAGESHRILIVDDEPYVVDFVTKALTKAGFQVRTAWNGKEALAKLEREAVDLVITDLVMPEFEGMELISELRRKYPNLPVLAISGAFGGMFLKTARVLGARAVLAKPFSPKELLEAVKRVLQPEIDGNNPA